MYYVEKEGEDGVRATSVVSQSKQCKIDIRLQSAPKIYTVVIQVIVKIGEWLSLSYLVFSAFYVIVVKFF